MILTKLINLLSVSLVVVLMATSLTVIFAEESAADECGSSVPVYAGQPASCSGVIFPQTWALQAIQCIDVDLPMFKSKHQLCGLTLSTKTEEWQNLKLSYERQLEGCENIARQTAGIESPWHNSKALWFVIGAATSAGLIFVLR